MKRVFLNEDSSIKCVLEGIKELIELNTGLTDNYVDDIEPNSPTDYWEINLQQFISIGAPPSLHHVFDYEIKQWIDPRSLDDIKAQKWTEVKSQRDQLEFSGFEFEGNIYDSDQISQGRILGAASAGLSQVWTLADNTTVNLTADQLVQIYQALQTHTASVHQRGRTAREVIMSATTKEDVESVTL